MILQVEAVSAYISFLKRNVDGRRNDKTEIVPVEVADQDPKLNHEFQAWFLRWQ